MSNGGLYITKRDGKLEAFSLEKIKVAISKAFLASGFYATDEDLNGILSRVRVTNGITVEEIQNQVETALMAEQYYTVAKNYILYRQKHTEDREIREKIDFLSNYVNASNAATGSKYDANANVEKKNIATLIGELPKSSFIRINRRLLTDRITICSTTTSSTRTMRPVWPTTAPPSPCIPGSTKAQLPSAATQPPLPSSVPSAVALLIWCSWSPRNCRVLVPRQSS